MADSVEIPRICEEAEPENEDAETVDVEAARRTQSMTTADPRTLLEALDVCLPILLRQPARQEENGEDSRNHRRAASAPKLLTATNITVGPTLEMTHLASGTNQVVTFDQKGHRWHGTTGKDAQVLTQSVVLEEANATVGSGESNEPSGRADEIRALPDVPDAEACPICLDAMTDAFTLRCSHSYCRTCIVTHVSTRRDVQSTPDCPCCKQKIRPLEIDLLGANVPPRQSIVPRASAPRRGQAAQWPSLQTPSSEERRELARAAGRMDMRLCPRCNRPILKNGGCPSMQCICGRRFRWETAVPVRPCRHPHRREGEVWSHTCTHCSRQARVESAARNTGLVSASATIGVAAIGVAIPVGLAVATAPAAIFGPMALTYEALRPFRSRKSRRRKNPFIGPSTCGLLATFVPVAVCLGGYESD